MEDNDLRKQRSLKEESITQQGKVLISSSELDVNNALTNEQKLEYLSKLIREAEYNLSTNGINKK